MTILFTIFLWKNKWISFCYRITWLELNNPEKLMMTLLKDLLWWFFKNFMQKDKNMDIGIVHPIIIFPQKHHTELDFVFSSKTSQFRSLFFSNTRNIVWFQKYLTWTEECEKTYDDMTTSIFYWVKPIFAKSWEYGPNNSANPSSFHHKTHTHK